MLKRDTMRKPSTMCEVIDDKNRYIVYKDAVNRENFSGSNTEGL